MILSRIKRIIDIQDDASDDVLTVFIDMYSRAICLHTGTNQTPTELEFILIEAVCSRWQRRGSEGMKSEKIDVVTQQFTEEVLKEYMPYIEQWKSMNVPSSGLPRIRLL